MRNTRNVKLAIFGNLMAWSIACFPSATWTVIVVETYWDCSPCSCFLGEISAKRPMFGKWSHLFDLSKKKHIYIINPNYCSFQTSLSLKSAINPIQSAFSLVKLTIFPWGSSFSLWFAPIFPWFPHGFPYGFPMLLLPILRPRCRRRSLRSSLRKQKLRGSWGRWSLLVKIYSTWPWFDGIWWDKNMG